MKNEETINLTVADLRRAHDSVSCSTAKQVIKALKPEAFEEHTTYSMGQRFINDGQEYMLCSARTTYERLAALINLSCGNIFEYPVKVKDLTNITKDEFYEISGSKPHLFKLK